MTGGLMLRAFLVLLAASPALAGATVHGIDVVPASDRIDVVVRASEPLTFQSWAKATPPVLVVDLLDTAADPRTLTPGGVIESVDVTRHDTKDSQLSRVALKLKSSMEYDVTAHGNDITISLFPNG
ncbi:MAG TPA: AMIN domain-containing protein, partial [Myxococcota bacterium]